MWKSKVTILIALIVLALIFITLILTLQGIPNIICFMCVLISIGLLIIDIVVIITFIFIAFIFKRNDTQQAWKYALIATSCVIATILLILALNPLRKSESQIRKNMLLYTPIGTSMDNVIKVVERNNWKIRYSFNNGYSMLGGIPSGPYYDEDDTIVGIKSIEVKIGEYCSPFITSVSVFYAFDEESNLVDIAVGKDMDTF